LELPEGNYKLVRGETIELPAESDPNVEIAIFLTVMLAQVTSYPFIRRGTETFITFINSREVTSRYSDLLVLSKEGATALNGATRSAIASEMPAPRLVIEVVTPGAQNYDRDYVDKRQEYAARSIFEYWIADLSQNVVVVLHLQDQYYLEIGQFRDPALIVSPTFPGLQLTAQQVLNVG
jgi:Uma2 family endonuclease